MKLRIVPLSQQEIQASELRKVKFFYQLGRVTFFAAVGYITLMGFMYLLVGAIGEEVFQIMRYFLAKMHG